MAYSPPKSELPAPFFQPKKENYVEALIVSKIAGDCKLSKVFKQKVATSPDFDFQLKLVGGVDANNIKQSDWITISGAQLANNPIAAWNRFWEAVAKFNETILGVEEAPKKGRRFALEE